MNSNSKTMKFAQNQNTTAPVLIAPCLTRTVVQHETVKDTASLFDLPEVAKKVTEVAYKITLTHRAYDRMWLYLFNEAGDLAKKVMIPVRNGITEGKVRISPAEDIVRIGLITLIGECEMEELILKQGI